MFKNKWYCNFCLLLGLFLVTTCKDRYNPPAIESPNKYLVVDGFINSFDSTSFTLTFTRNLSKPHVNNLVSQARILVEGDNGFSMELNELQPGVYKAYHQSLNPAQKYRLKINLNEGKDYVSAFVPVKNSPPIDTIGWEAKRDGVQLYISTHDQSNNSRYYRWEYIETWSYNAYYNSSLKFDNWEFVERPFEESIYSCWLSDTSTTLMLATSVQLGEDNIYKYPVIFLSASETNRFSGIYSSLFRQYVITPEAFQYWQNLKKLTELTGSIFDPQPSQLKGNIYCTSNKNELVLGFISAGSFTEKRIYIDHRLLPPGLRYSESSICENLKRREPLGAVSFFGFKNGAYIPIQFIQNEKRENLLEYADKTCVDCMTKGGTTKKPAFWIY